MESRNWPPRTFEVLARRALSSITSEALAEWAVEALEAGFDSPALRRLAGFSAGSAPSYDDVTPLLETAVAELGFPRLERTQVLLGYLEELARQLASGSAAVEETLEIIRRRIVTPLDHGDEVKPWCLVRLRARGVTLS